MNVRYWIFGIIISVVIHAVFLFVLSFSSSDAATTLPETSVAPTTPAVEPTPLPPSNPPSNLPSNLPANPPARSVELPAARAEVTREPAPTPAVEWVTYTVKKGDWLERLCKKAGCSVSEVARYNKTTYKKLSNLKVGQKIKLPKFQEN